MRLAILAACALSLAACASGPRLDPGTAPAMDADLGAPSKDEAIYAAAQTAASIADAIGQAPPATLANTTIDERFIRGAFLTFGNTLTLIEGGQAAGMLPRNSPAALAVQRGLIVTKAALNAASAAQRAGNAVTYTAALRDARAAFDGVRAALTR